MAQADKTLGVNQALLDLFRAHGVEATRQGDKIVFPKSGMKVNASFIQEIERPTVFTVEMEVRFEFAPGRTIIEAFAGLGTTREAAATDAFQSFAANSFHVLLAAFLKTDDPGGDEEPVSREEWLFGSEKRRVTAGNVGVRGKPPVQGAQLVGWVEQFEQKLKRQRLGTETHWVRLYYGQAKGKVLSCEVLLDNEIWGVMQSEVKTIAWPSGDDFYSMRLFLVIEGKDESALSSKPLIAHATPKDEVLGARTRPSAWRFWKR